MYKIKRLFDLIMLGIGVMVIIINFGNAITGDYQPEWYLRVIGVIALIGAPSIISRHSVWIKQALLSWEQSEKP